MVLPEGVSLPPIGYSVALVVGLLIVGGAVVREDPPVTPWTVLGFVPWIVVGAASHVLYVEHLVGEPIRYFLGTPAVYAWTAILAGVAWLVAVREPVDSSLSHPVPVLIGSIGAVIGLFPIGVIVATGLERGSFAPGWPIVALVLSVILTVVVWIGLQRGAPAVVETTGVVGITLVFSHVLDGISTTVGIDVLGADERSPLPRLIMDLAGHLPLSNTVGTGWAFVLVKLGVAVALLWLFVPFVRDTPRQANLFLLALAAVGLGPGVHNLLLFAIAG